MLHSLLLAVVGIVIALGSARPAAAALDVLLKSGDVAPDGRVLSEFVSPLASSKTKVAFLGTTSAVITESGGTFTTVAKTGDPLPAPLIGTFNAFFDPVINDGGNVAFRASLNSPSADSGLFYCCDAGAMVPVALTGGTSGGTVSIRNPPDMNDNGDIVYERGTTLIYLWDHASLSTVPIAAAGNSSPGGGTFTRFGERPVVNDAERVAFEGEVGGGPEGIFASGPFAPIDACALEDAPSPIPGGTYNTFAPTGAVSINAAGKVAFTSNIKQPGPDTSGVFLCDPSVSSVVTIAKEGDLVSGAPITGFDDEFVGVDAADSVAFEPIAAGRRLVIASGSPPFTALTTFPSSVTEFAPRLTTLGRVIWRRGGQIERFNGAVTTVVGSTDTTPIGFDATPHGPSINNAGVSVFSATHAVLYLYDRGALEVVAAPGTPSPGVGTLGSIIAPAIRRSSLAFAAVDGGGTLIALKKGRNAPIQVVHSGDPAPGGGTFDLGSSLLDVTGSKVLFQSSLTGGVAPSGLFRVNTQTGQVDTLALQGDMAPSGEFFQTFLAIHAASGEAAFVATLTGSVDGIFLTSHLGLLQVVLEGDVMPDTGGGTLDALGPVAVSSNRVAFMGRVSGGTVSDSLFLWDHGRITRLVSAGDPAVAGETFGSFLNGESAGSNANLSVTSSPAFVSTVESPTVFDGLFFARANGSVTPVLLYGDPTPLGGVVDGLELDEPITRVGNSVILEAAFSAASGSSVALVRAKP